MSTVKQLSITYNAVNQNNTFTNGDVINGNVIFEVSKEVTIESLFIKCKGEAKVSFSERRNDKTYHYSAHERYFKLKQYFIQDPSKRGKALGLFLCMATVHLKTLKWWWGGATGTEGQNRKKEVFDKNGFCLLEMSVDNTLSESINTVCVSPQMYFRVEVFFSVQFE